MKQAKQYIPKPIKKTKYTCRRGDFIMHRGKKMCVASIICQGRSSRGAKKFKGEKATISAYNIMPDNGQVLKRSPHYISNEWEHL